MRLTVLGSGTAVPVADRFPAGYWVQDGDTSVLVDCGPGTLRRLAQAGGSVREKFEGRDVRVSYDPEAQVFEVEAPDDVEVIEGYWFAWSAFHPDTTTYVARKP